jgi:hypothetical protein
MQISTNKDCSPEANLAAEASLSDAICRDISRVLERHGFSNVCILNGTERGEAHKQRAQWSACPSALSVVAFVLAVAGAVGVMILITEHMQAPIF